MGDSDDIISYWADIADYDLETANAMLVTERYLYVGFMCHQTIEKLLKAYYVRTANCASPYIHNLSRLASLSGVYEKLDENQRDLLDILEPLNIEARYPKEKNMILESLTREKCELLIEPPRILVTSVVSKRRQMLFRNCRNSLRLLVPIQTCVILYRAG